jgi:hypothetical protein
MYYSGAYIERFDVSPFLHIVVIIAGITGFSSHKTVVHIAGNPGYRIFYLTYMSYICYKYPWVVLLVESV